MRVITPRSLHQTLIAIAQLHSDSAFAVESSFAAVPLAGTPLGQVRLPVQVLCFYDFSQCVPSSRISSVSYAHAYPLSTHLRVLSSATSDMAKIYAAHNLMRAAEIFRLPILLERHVDVEGDTAELPG